MSYIIAYVRFEKDEIDYPVNCFRTDLKSGDLVFVRMNSKGAKLRLATVTRLEFLNWNCINDLECLVVEAKTGPDGIVIPFHSPIAFGMARLQDICNYLQETGWIPQRPNNRAFKIVYSNANRTSTSNIFVRSNGIDIQLLHGVWRARPKHFASIGFAPSAGPTVRHFLSQSGINLLEVVARFADAFSKDCSTYDEFFKPIGKASKITDEMRRRLPLRSDDEDRSFNAMLYNLLGGNGGDVYIGDGLSMSNSGQWIND